MKTILNSKGVLIDDFDLLIGATALTYNMIMVTDNVKHFSPVSIFASRQCKYNHLLFANSTLSFRGACDEESLPSYVRRRDSSSQAPLNDG